MFASLVLVVLSADVRVEMEVRDVIPAGDGSHAVVLSPKGEELILPIFVGPAEASAIKMKLDRQTPIRPMTHDLLETMIRTLGGKVKRIDIDDLKSSTFLAVITVVQAGKSHQIDARPSDSIALALRTGAPIFTARRVIDEAGVTREDLERRSAPTPKPSGRRLGPGGAEQL